MGGNGADATDGIGVEVGKFETLLFGHLLDFEREDAQLVEHGFHTFWQHA